LHIENALQVFGISFEFLKNSKVSTQKFQKPK